MTTTETPAVERRQPRRPRSGLQTTAYWVVIVVGILIGVHLIIADVILFRVASSFGNAFGPAASSEPATLPTSAPTAPAELECVGYGCSPEQDAALLEREGLSLEDAPLTIEECDKEYLESELSNAELLPLLEALGCDTTRY